MVKKKKEYLVAIGGKVPPAVRRDAESFAASRKWTLSQYVCEAVKAAIERDQSGKSPTSR